MNGKRDLVLVRRILEHVEANTSIQIPPKLEFRTFDGYDQGVVVLHIVLLREAGFIVAHVDARSEVNVSIERLTWAGYIFLDELRKAGDAPSD
ncbi:hypothetical protein P3T23_009448 [Paraburkholderia sp. GAS448]|uniref:DUF2513 domain-containing protein n=1 Tax=Paraburkholderia sp. GAS448 TaxID=3035136 RepID=UPI003D26261A